MSYIFRAVLSKPDHKFGDEVTLAFPISSEQYDHTIPNTVWIPFWGCT